MRDEPKSVHDLRQLPLFEHIDSTTMGEIARQVHITKITRGSMLISQGDQTQDVYVVISGRMLAQRFSPDGREILYAIVKQGEYVGELAAIDKQPRSLSVYCVNDAEICVIPATLFSELMACDKNFCNLIVHNLVRKIRFLSQQVHDLTVYSVSQRVTAFIIRFAIEQGQFCKNGHVTGLPNQIEIANTIGATREAVSRCLTQLKKAKIIHYGRQEVIILDHEGLLKYCDATAADDHAP